MEGDGPHDQMPVDALPQDDGGLDPAEPLPLGAPGKARRRRSPQDDKALSYAKDRRNSYGENDKSSRKNIPLSKRLRQRAVRHRARQALDAAQGRPDEARIEQVDERGDVRAEPKAAWFRKWPDRPLGDDVIARLQRRADAGTASPDVVAEKISRIRRRQR